MKTTIRNNKTDIKEQIKKIENKWGGKNEKEPYLLGLLYVGWGIYSWSFPKL
jgi:hypothetical protein